MKSMNTTQSCLNLDKNAFINTYAKVDSAEEVKQNEGSKQSRSE